MRKKRGGQVESIEIEKFNLSCCISRDNGT